MPPPPPPQGLAKRLFNFFLESKYGIAIISVLTAIGVFQFANWTPLLADRMADVFAAGTDKQSTRKKITEALLEYLKPEIVASLLSSTLNDEAAKKTMIDTLVRYLGEDTIRAIVDNDVKTDTHNYLGAAVKIHHVFEKERDRFTFPVYVPKGHSLDVLLSYEPASPGSGADSQDTADLTCGEVFAFYFTVQLGAVAVTLPEDKPGAHPWDVQRRSSVAPVGMAGSSGVDQAVGSIIAAPHALQVRRGYGASYNLKDAIDRVRALAERETPDIERLPDQALKDIFLVNVHSVMMQECKQVEVAIVAMVGAPLTWPNTNVPITVPTTSGR
jgi:hypothetical protein